MKTVLVAIDGSEPSMKALQTAAEVAKGAAAKLEAVYVSAPNLLPPNVYPDVVAKLEAEEKKYADGILKKAAAEAQKYGVTCDSISVLGEPAEAIAELAERPDVWMVVIGSRGRGAVTRVLLGSVADRLVHISKKPVLVVR